MLGPLIGDNLVRIAFLDESGRSRQEPYIVVAGLLLHGDRQYRPLEERLDAIRRAHIPESDQDGFIFHAKDLFHGAGYFQRDKWPRNIRNAILQALAAIPREIGFPIVFGHLDKAEYRASVAHVVAIHKPEHQADVRDVAEHMVAFARCEVAIERQMYEYTRDEIAMLIAEDTDRVKVALKEAHRILKSPNGSPEFQELAVTVRGLPLKKIVDTVYFASKRESAPLQIADLCAFLIMRRLMRREDTQSYFEQIAPKLTWRAKQFGDRMGSEDFSGIYFTPDPIFSTSSRPPA